MAARDTTTVRTEHRIELPAPVVDAIAERLDAREAPDELDVADLAYEHVEQSVEFVTEDGQRLADVALDRC